MVELLDPATIKLLLCYQLINSIPENKEQYQEHFDTVYTPATTIYPPLFESKAQFVACSLILYCTQRFGDMPHTTDTITAETVKQLGNFFELIDGDDPFVLFLQSHLDSVFGYTTRGTIKRTLQLQQLALKVIPKSASNKVVCPECGETPPCSLSCNDDRLNRL